MTILPYQSTRRARGFTLLELLMTMAIIAILAAIAIPSYGSYVRKAYRADTQQYLMDLAVRQGEILIDSRGYETETELLKLIPTPATVSPFYTVTVTVSNTSTPPTFEITATAKGAQIADGNLTLKSDGTKTPAAKW